MKRRTKSRLTKSNGQSMSRFDVHDILRGVLIVLLSLLAWVARGIHTQQAEISSRLRLVEQNQVRIMTVLGIEPFALKPQNHLFFADFTQ